MVRHMRTELSFDGFGINGPDKYRSRVATFTTDDAGRKYGKLFEAAPEMLEALKGVRILANAGMFKEWEDEPWLRRVREAIDRVAP